MQLVFLVLNLGMSFLIFLDAQKGRKSFEIMPILWGVLCFFLPILFIPLYYIQKRIHVFQGFQKYNNRENDILCSKCGKTNSGVSDKCPYCDNTLSLS